MSGSTIANNDTGIFVAVDGADDAFFYGNVIEGNNTGVDMSAGKMVFDGNHFENNGPGGTLTNIKIFLAGGLVSTGNFFAGVTANRDIVIDANSTVRQYSAADTLNAGVTHDGSNTLFIEFPTIPVATTGSGKIAEFDHDSITGTNLGASNFTLSGYSLFDMQLIFRNNAGDLDIRSSSGNDILFRNNSGATRWTIDNADGNFVANGTVRMGLGSDVFANLGAETNGTTVYCSDCTKATPCAGSGSGALAKRINGAWDCD